MISQKFISKLEEVLPLAILRMSTGILLILCMSGCQWLVGAVVFVENVCTRPLDQVQVEVGGGIVELGRIEAGKFRRITPEIKADSAIRIRYRDDGEAVTCDGDVYFTVNMHVRVETEIGGGVCHVVDVTRT